MIRIRCWGFVSKFFFSLVINIYRGPKISNFTNENFFRENFLFRKFFLAIFRRFWAPGRLRRGVVLRGVLTHQSSGGGPSELEGGNTPPTPQITYDGLKKKTQENSHFLTSEFHSGCKNGYEKGLSTYTCSLDVNKHCFCGSLHHWSCVRVSKPREKPWVTILLLFLEIFFFVQSIKSIIHNYVPILLLRHVYQNSFHVSLRYRIQSRPSLQFQNSKRHNL